MQAGRQRRRQGKYVDLRMMRMLLIAAQADGKHSQRSFPCRCRQPAQQRPTGGGGGRGGSIQLLAQLPVLALQGAVDGGQGGQLALVRLDPAGCGMHQTAERGREKMAVQAAGGAAAAAGSGRVAGCCAAGIADAVGLCRSCQAASSGPDRQQDSLGGQLFSEPFHIAPCHPGSRLKWILCR